MPQELAPEFHLPRALVGQVAVFLAFGLVIYLLAREAARIVIKVLAVVAIVLAIAMAFGWLDQSQLMHWLERVGDWLIVGIQAVVRWIVAAWQAVGGKT